MVTEALPPLLLSRAELAYLTEMWPAEIASRTRSALRIDIGNLDDAPRLAGLASLATRELVREGDSGFEPTDALKAVLLGLFSATTIVEVAEIGPVGVGAAVLFDGPALRVGCSFQSLARVSARIYVNVEPLVTSISRLVCAWLDEAGDRVVLLRLHRSDGGAAAVLGTDERGCWYISDSEYEPDRAVQLDRAAALERLQNWLGDGSPNNDGAQEAS